MQRSGVYATTPAEIVNFSGDLFCRLFQRNRRLRKTMVKHMRRMFAGIIRATQHAGRKILQHGIHIQGAVRADIIFQRFQHGALVAMLYLFPFSSVQ